MLLDLAAPSSGISFPHDLGHTVNRPNGLASTPLGEYLVLRFLTPMEVRTANGLEECPPGTCLIYTPESPEWYRGKNVGFIDDWCHLTGRDVAPVIKQAGIPLNTLFRPACTDFYPLILSEIRREVQRREPMWQDVAASLILRMLLMLGRAAATSAGGTTTGLERQRERLRQVRSQVHEHLADHWTVSKMASLAGLGDNRFMVLYRDCFGVSPMEDLIQTRLLHAQWLLTNTDTTVQQAAEGSGFRSIHYFSRLFHRRIGQPPSTLGKH